jgi:hypothetical protein
VVDVLTERGLVDAITNEEELRKAAAAGTLSVYCGFDPTADSLHLGNLLGILVLVWFQVRPPPPRCVSQALVETSKLVLKGYDRNCLHHDLEVLNTPVPSPSTPSSFISLDLRSSSQ